MENVREEIEKLVFGYLDLSERAQDPNDLIDKITSLKAQTDPASEVACSDVLSALFEAAERYGQPLALVFDTRGRQFDFVTSAFHIQKAYKAFAFENSDDIISDIEEIGR